MAGFLAPETQGATAFEQPVVNPGANVNAFAGILGDMFLPQQQQEASPTSALAAARQRYWSEHQAALEVADVAERQRMIEQAFSNWYGVGGPSDPDINSAYTNITGNPVAMRGGTTGFDFNAVVEDPQYQGMVALALEQNPGADSNVIAASAMNMYMQLQANSAAIENFNSNGARSWVQARGAYEERANIYASELSALAASANEDRVITPEEAEGLRAHYRAMMGDLRKPQGISDDDWNSYVQTSVKPLEHLLEGYIAIDGDIAADTQRAYSQILAKATTQGLLPNELMVRFANASSNPESLAGLQQFLQDLGRDEETTDRYLRNLQSFNTMTMDELVDWVRTFEEQDASFLDRTDASTYTALREDQSALAEQLSMDARLVRPGGEPAQTALQFQALLTGMNSVADLAVPIELANNIFGDSTQRALREVMSSNRDVGMALLTRSMESMSQQEAMYGTAVLARAEQRGLTINEDGSVVLNIEDPRWTEYERSVITRLGGRVADLRSFVDLTRSDLRAMGDTGAVQATPNIMDSLSSVGEITNLARGSERYTQLKAAWNRNFPEFAQEQQAIEDAARARADAQPSEVAMGGASSLMSLISATESGASGYSALYGHSQREGAAFSGVDVTSMTLGQVLEFQRQRGAGSYASYVAGRNNGTIATPVGMYQFVGSTLERMVRDYGLDLNERFSPQLQDRLFMLKAMERLNSANSPEARRTALRNEWEGLRNVSDEQLDIAIQQILSGEFNPASSEITETALGSAPRAPLTDTVQPAEPVSGTTPAVPASEAPVATTEAPEAIATEDATFDEIVRTAKSTLPADPELDRIIEEMATGRDANSLRRLRDYIYANDLDAREVVGLIQKWKEENF